MKYPPNPTNGMIFEATPGVFYQYNSSYKSWFRVTAPTIPLASEFNDGLMSSDDFKKLTGLLIPPPSISIKFEDCDEVFDEGLLHIKSDDTKIVSVNVHEDKLHENTGIVEFKLDTQRLVRKLQDLGQLRLIAPQGLQGPKGDPGEDGVDSLPVGPQGDDGKDGANAPWPGALSEEVFEIAQQNRAIVDISTKQVSPAENYIVVKRANIGNPDACPDTIIPQDVQSPWLLGFSTGRRPVFTQFVSPVTGEVCGWACNSELFYFDVDVIVQNIESQFMAWMTANKNQKESLAETWLQAMMSEFNSQKAALCCALEACKSRYRNENTRQFIETQRVQAAQSNLQLIIGGQGDKHYPPYSDVPTNTWNIAPTNYNLIRLSDINCNIKWQNIPVPITILSASAMSTFNINGSEVQYGPAFPIIDDSNIESTLNDVSVKVDNPFDISVDGNYVDGRISENDELIQWKWVHEDNDWILLVWYCKADERYAAKIFRYGFHDTGFGISENSTSCFQAGQLINIESLDSGVAFKLDGNGGSRATIEIK